MNLWNDYLMNIDMEFGSDFHNIKDYQKGKSILDLIGQDYRLYYDGRQALEALLLMKNVKRVWCPSYYCHESLLGVQKFGIEVRYYPCTPLSDPDEVIAQLPLYGNDALIRMNYFGLHRKPSNPYGNFLVIEDHSHDISSKWCLESDADWCFASLRKSFPIADGGILWSPSGKNLPDAPLKSPFAMENAVRRFAAMDLKADYLKGKDIVKDSFLQEFRDTEDNFEKLPISAISEISKEIIGTLDIEQWMDAKKRNWTLLKQHMIPAESYRILEPETQDPPFSMILLFKNSEIRNTVRSQLIQMEVYPAILWTIPSYADTESIEFGDRMLSIHCDARYSEEEIKELSRRINKAIEL